MHTLEFPSAHSIARNTFSHMEASLRDAHPSERTGDVPQDASLMKTDSSLRRVVVHGILMSHNSVDRRCEQMWLCRIHYSDDPSLLRPKGRDGALRSHK